MRQIELITITTEPEYEFVIKHGFNPLFYNKFIRLDIKLREQMQKRMFGHCITGRGKDIMAANERFFRYIWEHKPHVCEECLKPLREYSAVYCSHILSRGAYPEMAFDARNINLLCFNCHQRWENGDRRAMRIYDRNIRIINELKRDYCRK